MAKRRIQLTRAEYDVIKEIVTEPTTCTAVSVERIAEKYPALAAQARNICMAVRNDYKYLKITE
jgi:hypothetical protein